MFVVVKKNVTLVKEEVLNSHLNLQTALGSIMQDASCYTSECEYCSIEPCQQLNSAIWKVKVITTDPFYLVEYMVYKVDER